RGPGDGPPCTGAPSGDDSRETGSGAAAGCFGGNRPVKPNAGLSAELLIAWWRLRANHPYLADRDSMFDVDRSQIAPIQFPAPHPRKGKESLLERHSGHISRRRPQEEKCRKR